MDRCDILKMTIANPETSEDEREAMKAGWWRDCRTALTPGVVVGPGFEEPEAGDA